jgi:hypothetical protein
MPYTPDPNELGYLYEKTNDRGTWLSGKIHGEAIVVFKHRKTKDTQPDWKIFRAVKQAPPSTPPDDGSIPF